MLTIEYVNSTFDFSITVLLKNLSLAWPTLSVLISSHVLSFGLYLLCFLYLGFPSIAELAEIFFFFNLLGLFTHPAIFLSILHLSCFRI